MTIFILVSLEAHKEKINAAVEKFIPEDACYKLPNHSGWLIRHNGTSVDLSTLLGITGPNMGKPEGVGAAFIAPLTYTYFGFGDQEMWDWLLKQEELDK